MYLLVPGNGVESGGLHQAVAATQTTPDPKKPVAAPTSTAALNTKGKKQSRYQLQQRLQAATLPATNPPHFQIDSTTSRKLEHQLQVG